MKLLINLLYYALIVFPGNHAKPSGLQILNGQNATKGEFPYMVELRYVGCFYCGATIIAPKWVLTAGHCIDENVILGPGNYSIVYGTTKLYDASTSTEPDPETVIRVKQYYKHTEWALNPSGVPLNDIALFELEKEIPLGPLAQPIILPEEGIDSPIGTLGNLTGWGSSTANQGPTETLQKIQLPVLPNEDCTEKIDNIINGIAFNGTEFLCTDNEDNGQCNGDSGGPYVINGVQYGVVSWSIKPCGKYPGVFTRVALPKHRQWIKSVSGV